MGLTLAKAAEWTSAGSTNGYLEYSPMNQKILDAIAQHIQGFTARNSELGQLSFKSPLKWSTSLKMSDFSAGYTTNGTVTTSDKKTKDDQPSLSVFQEGNKTIISVMSFESIEEVLTKAGDKKITEVRACLEENRDPVAKIFGDRFATVDGDDSAYFRFADEIIKTPRPQEGGSDNEIEEKRQILKAVHEFHNLDVSMMKNILTKFSDNVRIHPKMVEDEYSLLKQFSGQDNNNRIPLKHIQPTGNFNFVHQNGCRAPPWRQLHGDIAYFLIKPHDIEEISVTASTNGWFENGGFQHESNEINYDKQGEIYSSLIVLLKAKSAQVKEFIDKSEHWPREDGVKSDDQHHSNETALQRQETDVSHAQRGQRNNNHNHNAVDKSGDGKSENRSHAHKLELSLKWKMLGIGKEEEKENRKEHHKDGKHAAHRDPNHNVKSHRPEQAEEVFSESESDSEEEEETPERRNESNADLPSEYWQIGKLVKYLKGGNQTSTIISLCALRDFQLNTEVCQLAIRDVGGLEVLLNLLETEEVRCKIGSLKILKEISRNPQIRKAIADLGGLQTMVTLLRDPNKDLKCLSAETIANVAHFRRARRTVRLHGGIRKLVALLDCPALNGPSSPEIERDIEVARCGALALWSCSKSTKNKQAMKKAGVIPLLARLLKSPHENMLIPVVGTLQECASEDSYRVAIRTEGMIEDLVKNLKSSNPELQMHCASTIFKCAEEKLTRDLVRQFGGLDPLVQLLEKQDNKQLLAAATGAIWKCAISDENVQRFQELKAVERLVSLLNNQPEEVLVNVVGALGEMSKNALNREAIRKAGGISHLVQLLTSTNQNLLVNVTRSVGRCANEPENMAIIEKMDGVRLLWSLLKNQNPEVQAHAAWAIGPCIDNVKDAGEMVRSFVGGLELIVSLLKSDKSEVQAAVCAAIASIAKDEENLAVITDHGVVQLLARLTNTSDDRLRCNLAEAIARCCSWGRNREDFGRQNAVAPLVHYLSSNDESVHRSTAQALFQLSKNPENCITMHEAGVVKRLLSMVGSRDFVLQEAAGGCIGNIRRLAMANEKARQNEKLKTKQTQLATKNKK